MLTNSLVRVQNVFRQHGHAVGVCLAILFLAGAATVATAENIFDAEGIHPKTSVQEGKAGGVPIAERRRPIPSATDLAKSNTLLIELFAEPLKDVTPAGRRRLAETLLAESVKITENPGDQYAMLLASLKAAEGCGSLPLCFKAIDRLAKSFEVDAEGTKSVAVFAIGLKVDSAADTEANLNAAVPFVEELVESGDYDGALKLCAMLKPLVQGELTVRLARRVEEIRATGDLFSRLHAKPEDPALNLAAGRYYCFTSGQWAKGVTFLAKGSDAALAKAASDEIAGAASTADAEHVGTDWWKVGESLNEPDRSVVRRHAAMLFAVALPKATGLSRKLLEKRIASAATPGTPEITRLSADAAVNAGRIVFVLDATGSMSSSFDALKVKFHSQITALEPTGRFDVLVMNEKNSPPLFADLVVATPDNKRKAIDFADMLAARGGTAALPFLKKAFDLKPDRIYLLIDPTDFDRKDKTAMLSLVRNSTGKKIPLEILAFEETPESLEFCASLAKQSSGSYHYFNGRDITP